MIADSADVRLLGFRARVSGAPTIQTALATVFPPGPPWLDLVYGAHVAPESSGCPGRPRLDRGRCERTAFFTVERHVGARERYRLLQDGELVGEVADPDLLVTEVDRMVTLAAVDHLGERYLLVHGGVVAIDGAGLLLPAAPGSGKTTLVAGLIAAGWRYLSDEVAVLDPDEGILLPFPRSLCVKPGSYPSLAPLYPALASAPTYPRLDGERVAYLAPPDGSRPDAPVPLRFIVLPRYLAGRPTTLQPLPRPLALRRLLLQSFNAHRHGARALAAAVTALHEVSCFSLIVGDLESAVGLLHRLVLAQSGPAETDSLWLDKSPG